MLRDFILKALMALVILCGTVMAEWDGSPINGGASEVLTTDTVTVTDTQIGYGAGEEGTLTISGGTVNLTSGWSFFGALGGTANLTMTGGAIYGVNMSYGSSTSGSAGGTANVDLSGNAIIEVSSFSAGPFTGGNDVAEFNLTIADNAEFGVDGHYFDFARGGTANITQSGGYVYGFNNSANSYGIILADKWSGSTTNPSICNYYMTGGTLETDQTLVMGLANDVSAKLRIYGSTAKVICNTVGGTKLDYVYLANGGKLYIDDTGNADAMEAKLNGTNIVRTDGVTLSNGKTYVEFTTNDPPAEQPTFGVPYGSWSVASDWLLGSVPAPNDVPIINSGYVCVADTNNIDIKGVYVGKGPGESGTLRVEGSNFVLTGDHTNIGIGVANAQGTLEIVGDGSVAPDGSQIIFGYYNDNGTISLSGNGALNVPSYTCFAYSEAATDNLNISDNATINSPSGWLSAGRLGSCVANQSGGSVILGHSLGLRIGDAQVQGDSNSPIKVEGTGVWNITGGYITSPLVAVGYMNSNYGVSAYGKGTLNIYGGEVITDDITIGQRGIVNIALGGKLYVKNQTVAEMEARVGVDILGYGIVVSSTTLEGEAYTLVTSDYDPGVEAEFGVAEGLWTVPANWIGGSMPGLTPEGSTTHGFARIGNDRTAILRAAAGIDDVQIGYEGGDGTLVVEGGTLSVSKGYRGDNLPGLSLASAGIVDSNGDYSDIATKGTLAVINGAVEADDRISLAGEWFLNPDYDGQYIEADAGGDGEVLLYNGGLEVKGGTVPDIMMCYNGNSDLKMTIAGDSLLKAPRYLDIRWGTAEITQFGGLVEAERIRMGYMADANHVYNMLGGQINLTDEFVVSSNGTGTFNYFGGDLGNTGVRLNTNSTLNVIAPMLIKGAFTNNGTVEISQGATLTVAVDGDAGYDQIAELVSYGVYGDVTIERVTIDGDPDFALLTPSGSAPVIDVDYYNIFDLDGLNGIDLGDLALMADGWLVDGDANFKKYSVTNLIDFAMLAEMMD